ncbi:Scr1 family TA system antitoxin-like transcriptional regulator [Streptomyces achromogenes]|uniref:Scr1 family TA system antitoxin-like transcriptional regulator n=1 Tax=Streptomyces achromogenes TaxID=67255 RepID=UPI0036F85472
MSVETAARIIRVREPAPVPALLRAPACARAVDDVHRPGLSPAGKGRRAGLSAARQERLRERKTRIWAVMPVLALHTPVRQ